MDKYEYKVRANEIKLLIEQGQYVQAAEIADTIDWRRVKSVMMLCMISDLYKINRRYEDARDMLLLAYERRPGGRTICYSLCELSIKMEEYVQAIEYYKEYVQATTSTKDVGRYILQYKLYEAQDVSLEERIAVLEKLKRCEYREKWGYELAYLYHRIGLASRCVEECDEMILWFGDGKYVIKAMELKMLHQPLTPDQQEKYDHRFDAMEAYQQTPAEESQQEEQTYSEKTQAYSEEAAAYGEEAQVYSEEAAAYGEEAQVYSEEAQVYSEETAAYGEEAQVYSEETAAYGEEAQVYSEEAQVYSEETAAYGEEAQVYSEEAAAYGEEAQVYSEETAAYGEEAQVYSEESEAYSANAPIYGEGTQTYDEEALLAELFGETQVYGAVQSETEPSVSDDTQVYRGVQEVAPEEPEELDIHVKTMDVGQYNTINLQAELAAGLREVLEEEEARANIENPITHSIMVPMMETEPLVYREADQANEGAMKSVVEEIESSEVFFSETGEIIVRQEETTDVNEEILPEEVLQEDIIPEEYVSEELTPEEYIAEEGAAGQIIPEEMIPEETALEEAVSEETALEEITSEDAVSETVVPDVTAEIVMEQMRQENTVGRAASEEVKASKVAQTEPPKSIAHILFQESDGQISLVMPEKELIEKQITGQINLADVLAEWERIKKENQEKREAQLRMHVMQQTGPMFTEFDASVRDGLLEQLERGKDIDTALEETVSEEVIAEEAITGEVASEELVVDKIVETETEELITEADEVEELEEIAEDIFVEEFVADEEVSNEAVVSVEEPVTEEPAVPVEEPVAEEPPVPVEKPVAEEPAVPVEEPVAEEPPVPVEKPVAEEPPVPVEKPVAEETPTVPVEEAIQEAPVVERDKAKIRSLTNEERELYGAFIQSRASEEQIIKAIDNVSLAAYTGNIVITGEEGMDTLTLAKNMIREIQITDSNFSGVVAKTYGSVLNTKDVSDTLEQLKNGALIIARASEMNADTVKDLYKSLQQESAGIVIVLLDTKKAINRFLENNKQLNDIFTARVDVEAPSNETLVEYARQYAKDKEYSIDDLGVLALHTRIETMQTIDHVVTFIEVKEIVDEAIAHANRKTMGHFIDVLFAKRYDEEDRIVLSEKDFV